MAGQDDRYDEFTRESLRGADLPSRESDTRKRDLQNPPYNTAGLPTLQVRDMPYLEDTNALGLMLSSNRKRDMDKNRRAQQTMFVRPSAGYDTVAHEAEHLLARQNLGFPALVRDQFIGQLSDNPREQNKYVKSFLSGLSESAPYLKEKYGINDAYITPEFIKKQGRVGLYEIFATLAGTEAAQRVDLTKDPELRKTLFKDKEVREAYNAVTGLRQTRLDARDLPPYTRQPEKSDDEGVFARLRKMMKFAEGGHVPNAGNKKLI